MGIINLSQIVQTVGEQYPSTKYPIPVIIILIIIAFLLIVGAKFAEKFAEDLYSKLKSKLKKPELSSEPAEP